MDKAIEEPGPSENPVIVSIEPQPHEIVSRILSALNLFDGPLCGAEAAKSRR